MKAFILIFIDLLIWFAIAILSAFLLIGVQLQLPQLYNGILISVYEYDYLKLLPILFVGLFTYLITFAFFNFLLKKYYFRKISWYRRIMIYLIIYLFSLPYQFGYLLNADKAVNWKQFLEYVRKHPKYYALPAEKK